MAPENKITGNENYQAGNNVLIKKQLKQTRLIRQLTTIMVAQLIIVIIVMVVLMLRIEQGNKIERHIEQNTILIEKLNSKISNLK